MRFNWSLTLVLSLLVVFLFLLQQNVCRQYNFYKIQVNYFSSLVYNDMRAYFALFHRLASKEILDQLNVVRFQETLLIFNENVDMAVAHVSVS